MANCLSLGSGGVSWWCDALLRVPCPLLRNISVLPFPPHLYVLSSRSESLFGCILQTHGGHKTESDLLFKSVTLSLDLSPLPPLLRLVSGPKRGKIFLSQLPKKVLLFKDLWRTSEEWCYRTNHSAHWWESTWMGGLAASQSKDGVHSPWTFLLIPVIFRQRQI